MKTNEELIQDLISKSKITDEGIISECLRLGVVFSNPTYYKTYRKLTITQIGECLDYIKDIELEHYPRIFSESETCILLPNYDTSIPGIDIWKGELKETDFVKELKSLGIFNEVTTGVTHFISCLLEGSSEWEEDPF